MTPLSHIKREGDFDLYRWEGRPSSWRNVGKIIEEEFDYRPPGLEMPITQAWADTDGRGGAKVNDPLAIYLSIPALSGVEGRPVLYQCSLKNLFWGVIQEERLARMEGGGGAAKAVFTSMLDLMEQLKDFILEVEPGAFAKSETETATTPSETGSSFQKREIPAAFGEVELSEKFGAGRSFGMN